MYRRWLSRTSIKCLLQKRCTKRPCPTRRKKEVSKSLHNNFISTSVCEKDRRFIVHGLRIIFVCHCLTLKCIYLWITVGDEVLVGDQSFQYFTADDIKTLQDDSISFAKVNICFIAYVLLVILTVLVFCFQS